MKGIDVETENATAWYANIEFVARFLGRRLSYVYEVKELVPGERLVMATTGGPMAMETTYSWVEAAGGATGSGPPSSVHAGGL